MASGYESDDILSQALDLYDYTPFLTEMKKTGNTSFIEV
jgi:hypothetical protein